jgi:hypothetical protein
VNESAQQVVPLCTDAAGVATLLGVSLRTVRRLGGNREAPGSDRDRRV